MRFISIPEYIDAWPVRGLIKQYTHAYDGLPMGREVRVIE